MVLRVAKANYGGMSRTQFPPNKKLGPYLKSRKISQEEFAGKMGFSKSWVSHIISGNQRFTRENIIKARRILECRESDIVDVPPDLVDKNDEERERLLEQAADLLKKLQR